MIETPDPLAIPAVPFAPVTPAKRPFVLRAVCDGRRLGLAVPFGEGIGELMREQGCTWSAPRRMWVCLLDKARGLFDQLQRQAARWPMFSLDDVRGLAAVAYRAPEADFL